MAVEVFPLVPPRQAFPLDFWNGVVHAAEDGEGGAAFSDGADTVYRLQARQSLSPRPSNHMPLASPGVFTVCTPSLTSGASLGTQGLRV